MKNRKDASLREFSWPTSFHLWDNIVEVIKTRDYMLITAFINSSILTVASVTLLGGHRRHGRLRHAAPAIGLDQCRRASWSSPA